MTDSRNIPRIKINIRTANRSSDSVRGMHAFCLLVEEQPSGIVASVLKFISNFLALSHSIFSNMPFLCFLSDNYFLIIFHDDTYYC